MLSQALELLRLLRALRCRGGAPIAAREALPRECRRMLMAASGRAAHALQGRDGGANDILVRFGHSMACTARGTHPMLAAPKART